ncbi:MAG: C-terminal target protein [Verrucomicrobiales bacterium]|nr:C-terminal target protein [Verrucomicrobiales bacterium]
MLFAHKMGLELISGQAKFWGRFRTILLALLGACAIEGVAEAQNLSATAGTLAKGSDQEVSVTFSAPVDPISATDLANYSVNSGSISEIRFVPLANASILTVSGLTISNSYTLTVHDVASADTSVQPLTSTNLSFTARSMTWAGVGGNETGIPQDVVAVGTNAFSVVSGALVFFSSQAGFSYEEATFAYEQVSGNFDRAVQVEYQDAGSEWSRAGVMVREAVDENRPRQDNPDDLSQAFSRYQAVQVNPALQYDGTPANNSYEINRRLVTGGETEETDVSNSVPPAYPNVWVRLARSGNTFRMYRSDTGTNWIKLGETVFDPPFATNAFVGIHFSPELANIPPDNQSYHQKLARFSHYGDPHAPVENVTPTIKIETTALGAQITFAGTLQSASTVLGPWTTVVTGSPYQIPNLAQGAKFFRATSP